MICVRYTTQADKADENQAAIEKVFEELATTAPDGLRYVALRLADGTFVHIADVQASPNPLESSEAFAAFQAGLPERVEPGKGPNPQPATMVGQYGFDAGL